MSGLGQEIERLRGLLQIWTDAGSSLAAVTTGLGVIATITTFTASLLNILVRGLGIEEGVGLERQNSKDESLSDLHFELVKRKSVESLVKIMNVG